MKMTPEEVVNYCHSGVLESVTAEQLLAVAEFYEEKLGKLNKDEVNYDTGHDDGFAQAVAEMQSKLNSM